MEAFRAGPTRKRSHRHGYRGGLPHPDLHGDLVGRSQRKHPRRFLLRGHLLEALRVGSGRERSKETSKRFPAFLIAWRSGGLLRMEASRMPTGTTTTDGKDSSWRLQEAQRPDRELPPSRGSRTRWKFGSRAPRVASLTISGTGREHLREHGTSGMEVLSQVV